MNLSGEDIPLDFGISLLYVRTSFLLSQNILGYAITFRSSFNFILFFVL